MSRRMYCRSRYQYSNQQGKDGSRKDREVFYQVPATKGIKRDSVRLGEAIDDYKEDTAFHSIYHTNDTNSSDTADNDGSIRAVLHDGSELGEAAMNLNMRKEYHYFLENNGAFL